MGPYNFVTPRDSFPEAGTMLLPTALRSTLRRFTPGSRPPWRRRPWLEVLEGRLAPTVSLSVSDPAPFPKPDTGQLMGIFVVTRSGDRAPEVLVDYQTQDGVGATGAHAGTDYVATSGTLDFAPNQTAATVTVPIVGNNIFQADKTFTLNLANPRTAAGGFTPPQPFAVGNQPYAVTTADINGDGRPDLIIANRGSNTVSVLLNTTPARATVPSFAAQQTFAGGGAPQSVAVGDFDGDGLPDVAVAINNPDAVSILLNTTPMGATAASFAAPQTFAAGASPGSLAVGDINADGMLDLAVSNPGSATVTVLLNTTPAGSQTLSFTPPQTFATGASPAGIAFGDFNEDGRPDLAVANAGSHTASVLLNTTVRGATTAAFAPQRTFPVVNTPAGPSSIAVGDFNGDGKPDLVVANAGAASVSVLLNTTPAGTTIASFAPQQTFAVGHNAVAVAVGDLNGDGKPDIAVADGDFADNPLGNGDDTVSVLRNTTPVGATSPSFAPQQTNATDVRPRALAMDDFNADGLADLVTVNLGAATASVLLNNPAQAEVTLTGSPATGTISSMPEAPTVIAVVAGTTPQTAVVNTAFAVPLAVDVRDGSGHLVQGVSVTFTAPAGGPSGLFGSSPTITVPTNASGRATTPALMASTLTGSFTVTARASGGSNPLTSFNLTNAPGAPAVLTATAGSNQRATVNTPFATNLVATLTDQFGNRVPGVLITFTAPASGPSGTFPGGASGTTDTNGEVTKTFTANTVAGSYTVTAQATGGSNPTANFVNLTNTPTTASSLLVSGFPQFTRAGVPGALTVTAKDPFGNTATSYRGTVEFLSTDSQAALPVPYTFTGTDNGTHFFSATLKTAGSQVLIAFDSVTGSLAGVQSGIGVLPGAATSLSVSGFPGGVTAGTPAGFSVTARDDYGNTVTGYRGTVHFTASDSQAILPGNYTFTTEDNGTHTFSARLKTAGSQSLTANDTAAPGITGTQAGILVSADRASTLMVAGFPASRAGVAGLFSVTALDAYGNVATGYRGTVHFSSSDRQAALPADDAFTAADGGVRYFLATLATAGMQSITATDTGAPTITGTQAGVAVSAAAPDHLLVTTSASTTVAGTPFDVTATVQDPFNNTVTGFTGTVAFSSADPYGATLPAAYTFRTSDQGTVTLPNGATLFTAGTWDVTATATAGRLTGSGNVVVTPAAAVSFAVTAPASASSGTPFDVSLTAQDPYGNTDVNYRGTAAWTTTDPDPGVTLPPNHTFQPADQGQVTFPGGVTLITPGNQTITATDTVSGISGNAAVTVISSPGGGGARGLIVSAATPEKPVDPVLPAELSMPPVPGPGGREPARGDQTRAATAPAVRPVAVPRSRSAGSADLALLDEVFAQVGGALGDWQ